VKAGRLTPDLLAAIAREIDAHRGDRLRSVHQDEALVFRLDLRGRDVCGRDYRGQRTRGDLRIHLGLPFPRVHFAAPRAAPKTPSAMAAALRTLLVGARLTAARIVPGERALALAFERGGEAVTLWIELFGGQANLYVVDAAGTVQLTPRGDVAKRRGAGKGALFVETPARVAATADDESAPEDASATVAALAADAMRAQVGTSAAARLRRFVKRKLAGARKARAQLEAALTGEVEAAEHHRKGELLRGAFHLLKPGLTRVRVPDYAQDPPGEVEIEIDPDLTPGEQIAHCFRRERKCRRAAEEARTRLAGAAAHVEGLAEAAACLAPTQGGNPLEDEALAAIIALLPEALRIQAATQLEPPPPQAARPGPQRALPWHVYVSTDGWRILVGRDARGNDELTVRHARPGDLFLHVRGATGSHVIVPTPRGKTVPKDTLLDAATLACHFSERRAAEHNEVDYTPRRYVRKPRHAPAGLVRIERAKTLSLRRDDERRARLLASRDRPGQPGPAS